MELKVTVQIDGIDVLTGKLFQNVRHGVETASFSYDPTYLENPRAFALAPDMPLGGGSFHSTGLRRFRAFEDCMPDRWGRNLMLRAERADAKRGNRAPRTLFEADMLAGVSDESRQGALRIWSEDGAPLSSVGRGVPKEVSIPSLLNAADRVSLDADADVKDLLAAGSSLGGARPKASVRDEDGVLCIAKFPKVDEGPLDDVCAWERVALRLMEGCGIAVPDNRLLRIGGRSVLIMRRFDRDGQRRIPYISGLTAIQGEDGEKYSYLDLVEFLEEEGTNPERDIKELWLRALFSCAIGNTDNHMRNYGLLRSGAGWVLSPAFDVNPTPGGEEKYLSSSLDLDSSRADPALALDACEYYRLSRAEARIAARNMAGVLSRWKRVARANGIKESSIDYMEDVFESGIARLRAL